MNPTEWFDIASRGGVTGVLGFFLWKFFKGDIRTKREVDELRAERDKWQTLAWDSLHLTDKATQMVERKT